MMKMRCWLGLLAVWVLLCSGGAQDCVWDPVPGAPAGLDGCQRDCCSAAGCDMIVFQPDGEPRCQLVFGCPDRNRELCARQASEGVTVLRRKTPDPNQDRIQTKEPEGPGDDKKPIDCESAAEAGPCRALLQRWFYNKDRRTCEKFAYGGCRGNGNNYPTQESCMETCTDSGLPDSKLLVADEDDEEYKDQCLGAPDPGPCRAAFPMFYYDQNAGSCLSFIYGGCRGNNNRYTTLEACQDTCTADGRLRRNGDVQNRWSPAVLLFVLLAVVSCLLLLTLLIVSLRHRGLGRRHSSASDKEELLPGERSSPPRGPTPGKA
ncbi:kunitz-type protease inhibitor 2-like isoform X2 [Antennarius striatus]|uniref:kunitz-type protease inhibitor 2-like isoform X2 n=1 Tax=Antennarius striatus TaxID=241820 RepID=UPI0035B4BD41